METLLAKQKAQAESDKQFIKSPGDINAFPSAPVTIYLDGTLGVGEVVKVQYPSIDGESWIDLYIGDSLVQLTNTDNVKTLYGPMEYRVHKTVTSAAVGVGISKVRGLNV